jgi:hypothetical protein
MVANAVGPLVNLSVSWPAPERATRISSSDLAASRCG